jgi:hypothetical protein
MNALSAPQAMISRPCQQEKGRLTGPEGAAQPHWLTSHRQAQAATLPASAGSSAQAGCTSCTLRRARQTALLHLNPEPKAICHTRSPRRTDFILSMFDNTYLQHGGPCYSFGGGSLQRQASPWKSSMTVISPDGGRRNIAPAEQRIL